MFRLLAIFALAFSLSAQSKFDVVSIRPVPQGSGPIFVTDAFSPFLPGGHFADRASLFFLIPMAYDIPLPDRQLIGVPEWGKRISYTIEAKSSPDFPTLPAAENEAQVRLMLRDMLADRFKLRLHMETREEEALIMTVEKSGFKIKEVAAPVSPDKPGNVSAALGDNGGRMIAKKSKISSLATTIAVFLKQEVIDQTGLSGYYDFSIRWDAIKVDGAPPPSVKLGPDGIALFLSALREELGLRFSKGKAPVKYWVIDSVEPPTEN